MKVEKFLVLINKLIQIFLIKNLYISLFNLRSFADKNVYNKNNLHGNNLTIIIVVNFFCK